MSVLGGPARLLLHKTAKVYTGFATKQKWHSVQMPLAKNNGDKSYNNKGAKSCILNSINMSEGLFPMSHEELRERYEHLRKLVTEMRIQQKKYFGAPFRSDERRGALIAAKALESKVDKFLES